MLAATVYIFMEKIAACARERGQIVEREGNLAIPKRLPKASKLTSDKVLARTRRLHRWIRLSTRPGTSSSQSEGTSERP